MESKSTGQPVKLRLRVCSLSEEGVEDKIINSLEEAGIECDLRTGLTPVGVDNPIDYDCLLVDWRNGSREVADYFARLAGREPVIALIQPDQALPNPDQIAGFNDFVSEPELGLSSFLFRLTRLVHRYRDPLSVHSIDTPEAQVLQAVVNNSTDWLFIKDLEHRFLSVSEEYVNSLDLTLGDVIGKNDLEVGFQPEVVLGQENADWPGFWPQDDQAVASGQISVETNPYWRVFTGDTRHRRTMRVPLKNHWGDVYALLVCSEDITAIVKTEQALRERSDMLEKVTQEKLKADHSKLMAELAVTAKNKFIATASHDLRQPLHALGLYLDVLETKLSKPDERALITKIKNSSKALSVLFNSLLDLSRLDAGVVDVVPSHFQFQTLLNGLSEEFSELASDKSLRLSVANIDAVVYTDPLLLERILRNLLQNAINYTESGSVDIRCELQPDSVRIEIADTGPGIPQYEQNAIFSEYYQLDNPGRRPTIGLGLGLAIVRRLVDLLDISFELRSTTGDGSTFSLELPLGDKSSVEEEKSAIPAVILAGHTVLIIDDEADILDGMQCILNDRQCVAITAVSAEDAITQLAQQDVVPSMIIADYRLEGNQTGDHAIELVREEFNSDIPAIIVTGDTSADRLKDATRSGFRLLHKPVQPEELVVEIAAVLSAPLQ